MPRTTFVIFTNKIESKLQYGFFYCIDEMGRIRIFPWETRVRLPHVEYVLHSARYKGSIDENSITVPAKIPRGKQPNVFISQNTFRYSSKKGNAYFCQKCPNCTRTIFMSALNGRIGFGVANEHADPKNEKKDSLMTRVQKKTDSKKKRKYIRKSTE